MPKGIKGFQKGHKCFSNRIGIKMSEETKQKIREANVGKIIPQEVRDKISKKLKNYKKTEEHIKKVGEAQRGEKHWNWKGGKQRERHNGDWRYINWRIRVFKRDDFTCQCCKKVGGYLEAHHIKKWSDYLELRYETDNGITLCRNCHKKIHSNKCQGGQY